MGQIDLATAIPQVLTSFQDGVNSTDPAGALNGFSEMLASLASLGGSPDAVLAATVTVVR